MSRSTFRPVPVLVLAALFFVASCVAASSAPVLEYEVLWDRLLVRGNFQLPQAIIRTSDGGYAVAGYGSADLVPGSSSGAGVGFWTVKFDRDGKMEWQRAFAATPPKRREEAYALTETRDGGLLIVGKTETDSLAGISLGDTSDPTSSAILQVGLVVKYNKDGTLAWKKTLPGSKDDPYDFFYALSPVVDGYVLLATTDAAHVDNISSRKRIIRVPRVVKLNDDGDIQWDRAYPDGGWSIVYGRVSRKIVPVADGGFVIAIAPNEDRSNNARRMDVVDSAGKVVTSTLSQRVSVIKFDRAGAVVKRTDFPAATQHLALAGNTDGYLVSGYYGLLWYAFLDRDLNLKWKKTVPEGIRINALWAAPDDSFYGIGAATSTAIAHISPSGEISQDTISGTASGSEGRDIAPGDRPDEFVFLWSRIPQTRAGIIKVRVPVSNKQ